MVLGVVSCAAIRSAPDDEAAGGRVSSDSSLGQVWRGLNGLEAKLGGSTSAACIEFSEEVSRDLFRSSAEFVWYAFGRRLGSGLAERPRTRKEVRMGLCARSSAAEGKLRAGAASRGGLGGNDCALLERRSSPCAFAGVLWRLTVYLVNSNAFLALDLVLGGLGIRFTAPSPAEHSLSSSDPTVSCALAVCMSSFGIHIAESSEEIFCRLMGRSAGGVSEHDDAEDDDRRLPPGTFSLLAASN